MAVKHPYLINLDDPGAVSVEDCGGKAAWLARLKEAGFPVPPGFCLTVPAYRQFLRVNRQTQVLTRTLKAKSLHLEERSRRAASIFVGCAWPEQLGSDVLTAYRTLAASETGAAVAVRSSAPFEDGATASFAGQHLTVLNVRDESGLLDAIVRCWSSLFTPAALAYRERMQISQAPAMAVLVQSMAPAEGSGVAFSADPVTGNADRIVINAAWGLGEAVVAGLVSPDEYIVSKQNPEIVSVIVGEKDVQIVPADGAEGVVTEAVPLARARTRVLNDDDLRKLTRLVLEVERFCSQAQDVEWSKSGDEFFLLQARPITFLPNAHAIEPSSQKQTEWVSELDTPTDENVEWTAANIQEVLPGLISPLTWSFSQSTLGYAFTYPAERVGVQPPRDQPYVGLFYGQAFLNLTALRKLAENTPGTSAAAIDEQYLGKARASGAGPRLPEWRDTWAIAKAAPFYLRAIVEAPIQIRAWDGLFKRLQGRDDQTDISTVPVNELVQEIARFIPYGRKVTALHIGVTAAASVAFELLGGLARDWLEDGDGQLVTMLMSGLGNIESAGPARDLWDLSRQILRSPELMHALEVENRETRLACIRRLDTPAAREFTRTYDHFLARHGHRSVKESELAAPSWRDDPETVLSMIENCLRAGEDRNPERTEAQQRELRNRSERMATKKLSPLQLAPFLAGLSYARRYITMRERTKSLLIRSSARARWHFQELARRLSSDGYIERPEDLFYLTWHEVTALVRNPSDEMGTTIQIRKAEEQRNANVRLPEVFRGRPHPIWEQSGAHPAQHMQGIPVSPGRYAGRARVIIDPRTNAGILPGEVLVAPVTDTGWTPLFLSAGALVVDVGGPLSHGSTVAREFGIPAVVNVKHGTRSIRTGQWVTVDGNTGTVGVEDRNADDEAPPKPSTIKTRRLDSRETQSPA